MPDTPPPPSGIDKKIADAVANEDYELAAKLKKVKTQPPPPPPKKGKKAGKAAKAAKEPVVSVSAEDQAAMRLQCAVRQRHAREEVRKRRAKIAEWEAEMARAEAEAARMLMEMEIAEYRREQEKLKLEREREQARKKALRDMLEAAFDGDDENVVSIWAMQTLQCT